MFISILKYHSIAINVYRAHCLLLAEATRRPVCIHPCVSLCFHLIFPFFSPESLPLKAAPLMTFPRDEVVLEHSSNRFVTAPILLHGEMSRWIQNATQNTKRQTLAQSFSRITPRSPQTDLLRHLTNLVLRLPFSFFHYVVLQPRRMHPCCSSQFQKAVYHCCNIAPY